MRRKAIWLMLVVLLLTPLLGPGLYDYWHKATGHMMYSDGVAKMPELLAPHALVKATAATFSHSELKMHKDKMARLWLEISAAGKVTRAEIRYPRDKAIDKAGLKLARDLRFSPAIHEGGRPMAYGVPLTIDFGH